MVISYIILVVHTIHVIGIEIIEIIHVAMLGFQNDGASEQLVSRIGVSRDDIAIVGHAASLASCVIALGQQGYVATIGNDIALAHSNVVLHAVDNIAVFSMQGYVACVGFQRCAVHYITLGSGQGNILACINIVSEVGQALGRGQGNALAGLQHLVVIQGAMFCLEDDVAGGDVHARAIQALSIACFIGFGFFTCCIHQAVEIIVVGQIALDCF